MLLDGSGAHSGARNLTVSRLPVPDSPAIPAVVSIQVGRPRTVAGEEPWVTSFFKTPVTGPLGLETNNLDGDEQADLRVHGGPDKAVCVYSANHFPEWRRILSESDFGAGAFGENFSVSHMDEDSVCVGDVYAIGTAVVQVSQPRSPCWKLAARWNRADLPRLVLKSGRTGWYFRVLQRGLVTRGDELSLSDRPCGEWSIARVNEVSYATGRHKDATARRALSACAPLARVWRQSLLRG
jgi:MOSC domain-containing protein YiiM